MSFAQNILQSFEIRFDPFNKDIQNRKKEVDEEVRLVLHKAIYQEQQLQLIERKEATTHRKLATAFRKTTSDAMIEQREWRLQRDRRKLRMATEVPGKVCTS